MSPVTERDPGHPLFDYLAGQLAGHLKARRVVVWYDPRREFEAFLAELAEAAGSIDSTGPLPIGDLSVRVAHFTGSYFGLRAEVEPLVARDRPEPLLIYLPGVERDRQGSVLMELEKAGTCYEPQLKRLALNVLRKRFTDGRIDELLRPASVPTRTSPPSCGGPSRSRSCTRCSPGRGRGAAHPLARR